MSKRAMRIISILLAVIMIFGFAATILSALTAG